MNTAVKTMLGMKNKYCVNVKVYIEIPGAASVSVSAYPSFPLNRYVGIP